MKLVTLHIHEDADRELHDAADYYDAESLGLGSVFLDQIEESYDRVRRNPLAAEEIDPGIRKLVLAKFPYTLIYEFEGDSALVLAVAHQRQRPHYWRGRRGAGI